MLTDLPPTSALCQPCPELQLNWRDSVPYTYGWMHMVWLELSLELLACCPVRCPPQVLFAMVSKFGSALAWTTLLVYAAEVLPTSCRSTLVRDDMTRMLCKLLMSCLRSLSALVLDLRS